MYWEKPYDGANIFHFLAHLDAHHPAVPRFMTRLALTIIPDGILERFVQIPPEQDFSYCDVGLDDSLHNPLTYAVFSGNHLLVELLLTLGADPDCRYIYPRARPHPSSSSWPILYAATCKDTVMLRSLLGRGADVHVARRPFTDRWGFSGPEIYGGIPGDLPPLHLAAYHRRLDSVRLLVLHGADVRRECDLVDPQYLTPYEKRIGCKTTGSARDTVTIGIKDEHRMKRGYPEDEPQLHESIFTDALEEYDVAVQAGLGERRLFVLCCLTKGSSLKVPSLPGPLLAIILNLASLW